MSFSEGRESSTPRSLDQYDCRGVLGPPGQAGGRQRSLDRQSRLNTMDAIQPVNSAIVVVTSP
jgi:hypothetical protein